MVRIDVLFTRRDVGHRSLAGEAAVVIDVLRATTTIAAALASGAACIIPVASIEEARRVAACRPGAVLGGERAGLPQDGFTAGNSPLEYTPELVYGRSVILTTTNGTRALEATRAAGPDAVATGALVNASVVAQWMLDVGRDVTLVCAGTEGEFSLEDASGAGCIIARCCALRGEVSLTDAARASLLLWERYAEDPVRLMWDSRHGQKLRDLGFCPDLTYCASIDRLNVLPIWSGDRLVARETA